MTWSQTSISTRMLCVNGTSFQRSLAKLDRLITQESVPIPVLTAVLAADPMITALILAEANASSVNEITGLSAAMLQIGLGSVLGLIRGSTHIMSSQRQDLAACWSQANASAALTRMVAGYCASNLQMRYDDDTLHNAGLLHDMGTIIAILQFPTEYARACARLEHEEVPLSQLVKEELGTDTAHLGQMLALTWRLPLQMTACIRYHAQPSLSASNSELVGLVHVARILARSCGFTCLHDRFVEPFDEETLRKLDLHLSDIERIVEQFFEEREDFELYEGALGALTGIQPIQRR